MTATQESVETKSRTSSPLKPFMDEIVEKVLKDKIMKAHNDTVDACSGDNTPFSIARFHSTFKQQNNSEVSAGTFREWCTAAGLKFNRAVTVSVT